jgi:protein-disulfide isomerase
VATAAFLGASVLIGCAHRAGTVESAPPLDETEASTARALCRAAEVKPERLDGAATRRLVRLAAEQRCPCPGAPGSLADCLEPRLRCVRAPFAARAIIRALLGKETDEAITARLLERFGPREPEILELDGAPCRGPATAPAQLVVFSDFECPFCGVGRKIMELLEKEAGPRLRLCFKNYPLVSIHSHARLAAQAAMAAALQQRFWPMHDRLFDHPDDLGRDDLLEHARAAGLEMGRFTADLESPAVQARVERDRAEAIRLGVRGTPTFFINGREMTDPKTVPDFLDWIAEALATARLKAGRGTGGGPESMPVIAPAGR